MGLHCPDNSSVSSEPPPLTKVGVSFWFNVPEATVDSVVLAKYKRRISEVLGVPESIIDLLPAFSQSSRRRLLADNWCHTHGTPTCSWTPHRPGECLECADQSA